MAKNLVPRRTPQTPAKSSGRKRTRGAGAVPARPASSRSLHESQRTGFFAPNKRPPRVSPLKGRQWQGEQLPELPLSLQEEALRRQSQNQNQSQSGQHNGQAPPESPYPQDLRSEGFAAQSLDSIGPEASLGESKDFRPPTWASSLPSAPEESQDSQESGEPEGSSGAEQGSGADQTSRAEQESRAEQVSAADSLGQRAGPSEQSTAEQNAAARADAPFAELPKTGFADSAESADSEDLAREKKLRQQEQGQSTLRNLEEQAREQELERVRRSKIEVPALDLKVQEGNSFLHMAHLQKRYGRKYAVADVSISLRQGEVVGLLGPNGAGKTTCFYMIAGFVHPNKGDILLNEENITKWPMYKRARRGISYLPQEASIFRALTVEQNLLAILEYRRDMNRKARKEMAEFLMERLGVIRLRKQKAFTLSGGERRRVEVARALTLEPSFLLLDEPFAGIDPIAVSEIKGIIRALAQSNIGILITDHNVRETLDITDRSYIVNLGEILVSGSRAELIASKAAREVYLGAEFH